MRYDFTRLSPEQFEEMAVSLYAKVLGFETKIYGAGPDGQREFTFDRPFTDAQGNEYTGMTFGQVKYRSVATKGDEFKWLKDRFEEEMGRFAEKEEAYRPRNYFFITNLVLTPVKDTGIKDKIDKLAASYRELVPNIFIVGYDELCKLLDNNESVRAAYSGLILPGDVLAELLDTVRKDFSEEINVYLRSAFSEDIYTRIEQAGSIPENMKTLIADVGVDLSVRDGQRTEGKALDTFIRCGNTRIAPREGRYIVIGGPGKGKSTITQFLAQIYRASYLTYAGAGDEETEAFLAKIRERFEFEVKNCRIPFVVEIKRYADWIARRTADESTSLLAYIAGAFNRVTDSALSPKEIGALFRKMPWLLVFDGLDEVPESSNRKAVLTEIGRFMSTRLPGCDCMVIATSREQGYGGEFEMKEFRRLELADLSPEDCLKYLGYFFDATEERRDSRERYLTIIKKALEDNEKAALLATPLQATIMAIIVKSGGSLPNNRYDLFREYCDVVIKREAQKEILPVLNEDTSYGWIYELHQRIALHLMEASDSPENPAAELTINQLKNEIRTYLEEYLDRYVESNPENAELVCLRAVTERVCFLTENRDGVFSFSIRSMQEFFAGIGLVDGRDNDEIRETLLGIARRSYWRNTLLFAVGHLVRHTNNRKIGAIMKDICEEINGIDNFPEENFTEDNYCLFGSRLAVALLAENLFNGREQDGLVRVAAELYDNDMYQDVYVRLAGSAAKRLVERIGTDHGDEKEKYLAIVNHILPMLSNARNDFGDVISGYFERAGEDKFAIAIACMSHAEYLKEHKQELLDKCFAYYKEEIEHGTAPEEPFENWGYMKYICSLGRSAVSEKVRAYTERNLYQGVNMIRADVYGDALEPLFSREFLNLVMRVLNFGWRRSGTGFKYKNMLCGIISALPAISEEDIAVSRESSVPIFPLLVRLLKDRSREAFEELKEALAGEPKSVRCRINFEFPGYGIAEGNYEIFRAMTGAEEILHEHVFIMEAAASLDKGNHLYLDLREGATPDSEGIFDDLEKIIQTEEVSEEVLMTGIWLLIVTFDGSDGRCRTLAHRYLDAMQRKGVFYRRILFLLWLLYEAGDRDYVSTYRLGRYETGSYNRPGLISGIGFDKGPEDAVRLLEMIAYGNLPKEFLSLLRIRYLLIFWQGFPVDRTTLKRLEEKCTDNQEWMKTVKVIGYLSDNSSMGELLAVFEADNEDDQRRIFGIISSNYFGKKPPEEKRKELMTLLRWLKDSREKILFNECIEILDRTF